MRTGKTRILSDLSVGSATVGTGKIVDISSTVAGLGLPSMTTVQRDAIPSPTAGITIYNNTSSQIEYYDGVQWVRILAGEVAFVQDFVNADLTAGDLTVTHSLDFRPVVVQVYDNLWNMIQPDEITLTSNNVATVSLGSFGAITGTWNLIVYAPPDGVPVPPAPPTYVPTTADFPTQVGFGVNSTATDTVYGIQMYDFAAGPERAVAVVTTPPATPYTVVIGMKTAFGLGNHSMPGIAVADSVGGQLQIYGKLLFNGSTPFYSRKMNSPTSYNSDNGFFVCAPDGENVYFKFTDNGVDRKCYIGHGTDPANDFFAVESDYYRFSDPSAFFLTPDQIGPMLWTANNEPGIVTFTYYRTYNSIV